MTEFEPEHVSVLYENTAEFAEDFRPRLRQHEVFDSALDMVHDLSSERVPEDDIHKYWTEHNYIIDDLNAMVRQGKLLGRTAILEGAGIMIPSVKVTLAEDKTVVKRAGQKEVLERSLQSTLNPHAFMGPFEGFSIQFDEINDSEDDALFVPKLSYQVKAGTYRTPNTITNTFATGIVGLSSLSFEEDSKLDEFHGMLQTLYLLAPNSSDAINQITVALFREDIKNFELTSISYFSSQITDEISEPTLKGAVEDVLADMVKQRLSTGIQYKITTAQYSSSDSTVQQNRKKLHTSPANPFAFNKDIREIMYMDELEYQTQGVGPSGRRSLHVVIADDNETDYAFIPLRKILEIKK